MSWFTSSSKSARRRRKRNITILIGQCVILMAGTLLLALMPPSRFVTPIENRPSDTATRHVADPADDTVPSAEDNIPSNGHGDAVDDSMLLDAPVPAADASPSPRSMPNPPPTGDGMAMDEKTVTDADDGWGEPIEEGQGDYSSIAEEHGNVPTAPPARQYAHRLIVAMSDGSFPDGPGTILGSVGPTCLLGFETEAEMRDAKVRYEGGSGFVAEDIALSMAQDEPDGTGGSEPSTAPIAMTADDNPFDALAEAEGAHHRDSDQDSSQGDGTQDAIDETVDAPPADGSSADGSRPGEDIGVRPIVALLDTGAPTSGAVIESVSMLGDDGIDRNGHATSMLDEVLAQNPNVHAMSIKVLDDNGHGTASSVYAGIIYAVDHGATILSMSFAGFDDEGNAAIREAVRYALDRGVAVIAAAGNGGYDASLITPANIDGVFTVGAADNGKVSEGSNRGACVDMYVEAESTSVATAAVAGFVSNGMTGWRDAVLASSLNAKVPIDGTAQPEPQPEPSDGVDAAWTDVSPANGRYKIACAGNGSYVLSATLTNNALANGNNVCINTSNNALNQRWILQKVSGQSYYIIKNAFNSGYVMDVPGYSAGLANNTNVQIYVLVSNPTVNDTEFWHISQSGYNSSYYSIRNATTNYALTNANGSLTNGNNVNIYTNDNTVKMAWSLTAVNYTVTFNGNGSTDGSMATQTIQFDRGGTNLTTNGFTRTGYTFNGWNTKADGTGTSYANGQSVGNLTTTEGGNVTLYAKWTPNTYTVSFDAAGGQVTPASKSVTYGRTVWDLPEPTRAGHSFKGWYYTLNGSSYVNYGSDYNWANMHSVHLSARMSNWSALQDNTIIDSCTEKAGHALYVYHNVLEYTVYDDGANKYQTVTTSYNPNTLSPGWHDFDMVFTGTAMSLYVDSTHIGTTSGLSSMRVPPAGTPLLVGIEPTAQGTPDTTAWKYFTGDIANFVICRDTVRRTADSAKLALTVPAQNVTLHAIWEANRYSVAFNANGGTGTMATQTGFVYGSATTLHANGFTAPQGYSFGGWATSVAAAAAGTVAYGNQASVTTGTAEPNGTVTLYAIWWRDVVFMSGHAGNVGQSSARQHWDGATSGGTAVTSPAAGACVTIPSWTMLGWRTDPLPTTEEVSGGASFSPTGATYYAIYGRVLSVDYEGGPGTEGDAPATASVTQHYNSHGELSQPSIAVSGCTLTRRAYAFREWSGSDGQAYRPGDVITGHALDNTVNLARTLTAQWDAVEMGGTADSDLNPDADGDGHGDNISFTVPSSITFAIRPDGTLIAPTNAAIVNYGDFDIHLSSIDVQATSPYSIVADVSAVGGGNGSGNNQVRLALSAGSSSVDAAACIGKTALPASADWDIAANSSLALTLSGEIGPLSQDVVSNPSEFATVTWYVMPGHNGT